MKVIHWLAIVSLVSACSDRPDVNRDTGAPQPGQSSKPVATSGDVGPPPSVPPPSRAVESNQKRDARVAAQGPVTRAAGRDGVNPDAAVLQDFRARVEGYVKIHDEAAQGAAELKETKEPAEIARSQATLAARIRAARANAKHGDIFTPEVRHQFRRLLAPEMKGEEGREARQSMKDDAPPAGAIPFKVNAKYPEGQPLPTVPSNVLLNLPKLPPPLEYRIIGKHLVLLDSDADIIVDYIPNAIT